MLKIQGDSIRIQFEMIFKQALLYGSMFPSEWKKEKYCPHSQKRDKQNIKN